MGSAAVQTAMAGNVWDGGGASGDWSDLVNWDANTTPVSPAALQFGGVLQLNANNDLFAAGTQFNGITFLAGAGAFTLSGNPINLGGSVVNNSANNQTIDLDLAMTGSRTFTTNASGDLTLGGVVSGAFNFVKSGFGTLTFNGPAGSSYTGQTQVSGGTLMLDFANMATPANLLASTSNIQTGGGELYIKGKSGGATSQTLGNLTQANTSYSKVIVDSNGGDGTTLALGTVSHTAGNATLFDISTSGSAVTTSTGSANTVISAGFIVNDSGGTGFAVKNGSNTHILRYDDASLATTLANGPTTGAVNYSTLNSAASVTLNAGNLSLNTLTVDTTNGARSIDLGGTGIKTLNSIGILFRGANDGTISNGQIGANNAETIIHQLGSGKLTISGTVGSGSANLTKSGVGELVLSGGNTYTGDTRVLDGTLTMDGSLGTGNIIVGSAGTTGVAPVLTFGPGSSYAGTSATAIRLLNPNAVVNINQANLLGDTTGFTLTAGTLNLNASQSAAWTTATAIAINGGMTLGLGDNNALGNRTLTLGGGTVRANGGPVTIGNAFGQGNANSTIGGEHDLTFNGEFNNLGSATLTINNTALTTFAGGISLRDTGTAQRSLVFNGTGDLAITGVVRNNATLNGILDFKGSGTVTLSGNNTHTGQTLIGGIVNGVGTTPTVKLGHANALGFGGVSAVSANTTVNAGATLDLNGQSGIREPININGTGVGNNGVLINSNTATEAVIENGLAAIGVGSAGSGYADGAYAVSFTGGGGTGAEATANVVGGVVVSVQVTNPGAGYVGNPAASITGSGSGATFNTSASAVNLASASSIGGAGNIRINTTVTGTGGNTLTKVGDGRLTLNGANTYSGATVLNAGTLEVGSSGTINSSNSVTVAAGSKFIYNSSTALTRGTTLNGAGAGNRAVLGGTGSINITLALNDTGDTLSPGNSPGIQNFIPNQTWESFSYDWEINNFTGSAAGMDFDQLNLSGNLALTGGFGSYILNLVSLTGSNLPGDVGGFTDISQSWTILTSSGLSGFDAANWTINTSGFATGSAYGGNFTLDQIGNDLVLSYTVIPEPSVTLLGGVGLLLPLRRRVSR